MQSTLKGNWSDGTPVKLRFVVTSCKLVWPNKPHCDACHRRQPDYWGPRELNMHNLCIRACCNCIHLLETFKEEQWKWLCDYVGFDYSSYSQSISSPSHSSPSRAIGNKVAKVDKSIKICKMCKEDEIDYENSNKYCEACLSFRTRNNLNL